MKLSFISLGLFFFIIAKAQNFTSSKLPIVVINTAGQQIVDEPKVMASMGIIYNGAGATNNLTDPYNHYNGKIGIELRGQISLNFPQKSYGFELWDSNAASINRSILSMPSESDWILYAPYADKSLMRNVLAYDISRSMGRWASNGRYVEVVLNGSYVGVYILMEKIKRGSSRVNISKLNATDISGDAVTGGYIFTIDKKKTGDDGWFSNYNPPLAAANQKILFLYNYPKATNIVFSQQQYIKAYVDSFENALSAANFQDTANGYRKFIDVNSFIDYIFINEISRNIDAYRISSYFNKDKKSKGGKLIAGPAWDYDLAFGNVSYCGASSTTGWAYDFNSVCSTDYWLMPFWWKRFLQDTGFTAAMRCRWKQLRQTNLSNNKITALVDSAAVALGAAQQRQYQRWGIAENYANELDKLKQWLVNRLVWIDENIPNNGLCSDWPADNTGSIILSVFPNPFTQFVNINIQSRQPQNINIKITDAAGKTIFAKDAALTTGNNNINTLPVSNWAGAVYFLQITNTLGEKKTVKLLKYN